MGLDLGGVFIIDEYNIWLVICIQESVRLRARAFGTHNGGKTTNLRKNIMVASVQSQLCFFLRRVAESWYFQVGLSYYTIISLY